MSDATQRLGREQKAGRKAPKPQDLTLAEVLEPIKAWFAPSPEPLSVIERVSGIHDEIRPGVPVVPAKAKPVRTKKKAAK